MCYVILLYLLKTHFGYIKRDIPTDFSMQNHLKAFKLIPGGCPGDMYLSEN